MPNKRVAFPIDLLNRAKAKLTTVDVNENKICHCSRTKTLAVVRDPLS